MHLLLVALAVLFIALKLTNVIAWSWLIVLLPVFGLIFIPLAVFLVIAIIMLFS